MLIHVLHTELLFRCLSERHLHSFATMTSDNIFGRLKRNNGRNELNAFASEYGMNEHKNLIVVFFYYTHSIAEEFLRFPNALCDKRFFMCVELIKLQLKNKKKKYSYYTTNSFCGFAT
jgi:hypothetical protein